jgi:hypothetical protein
MPKIILINSSGIVSEKTVKNKSEMFKMETKCSKEPVHVWGGTLESRPFNVSIYGKLSSSKSTTEINQFELPPPVESFLLYGDIVLANFSDGGKLIDLTAVLWGEIYGHLFNGFEDLGEDTNSDEYSDVHSEYSYTKEGYVKDGFIEDDDNEHEPIKITKKTKAASERRPANDEVAAPRRPIIPHSSGPQLEFEEFEESEPEC